MNKLLCKMLYIVGFISFMITSISYPVVAAQNSNKISNKPSVNIGNYIEFGQYLGEPILWKCVSKDNKCLVFISEYMLCKKPYDAAESGKYYLIAPSQKREAETYGSNKWSNSNIREWLNSASSSVKYTTQPPTEKAVDGNWYDDEPGFLTNFSEDERTLISVAKHDNVNDYFYLLSLDEAKKYIGSNNRISMTKAGKQYSRKSYVFDDFYFWTRTPSEKSPGSIWTVFGYDCTSYSTQIACEANKCKGLGGYGLGGVLPAFNLKASAVVSGGSGTKESPYKLSNNSNNQNTPSAKTSSKYDNDIVFDKLKPQNNSNTLKAGDYIQFGTYLNKPIKWRIISFDGNHNPILFSEKIISFKPFDAAESGIGGEGYTETEKFGSNKWENSNIREWLNCTLTKVSFSTQPPTKGAVRYGENSYENEPGFLAGFTSSEKDVILKNSDGSKVFLLSQDELNKWVANRKYNIIRTLTTEAKHQARDSENAYWLRTSDKDDNCDVIIVNEEGTFVPSFACESKGVCPALTLDILKTNISIGLGNEESPYILSSARIISKDSITPVIKATKKSPIEVGWGDAANNELWIKYSDGHEELLVACRASTDLNMQIAGITNPQLSTDMTKVYFESAAYVTSNTVFVVDIKTKKAKFICAGSNLKVISTGEYKGYISVTKHEYAAGGGSYDREYVIDDTGRILKKVN